MAAKTKGKVIQMLNPENYIRQKAKGLPIYECLISSNWEASKFANIIIARQHSNGNITACVYLVDLMCLGIKDSLFVFNTPMSGYNEMVELFKGNQPVEAASYALVHNVIYAAVEYAEELGFKPYKVFTSVTRFMLEDDTDDIALIDIECGMNGKPCFVRGEEDTESDVKRILAQLDRTAGKGNYEFIIDEVDEVDDADYDDGFSDMTYNQKYDEFMVCFSNLESLDDSERFRFFALTESLIDNMIDEDYYEKAFDEVVEELEIDVDDDLIPNEMLGLEPGNPALTDEIKMQFLEVLEGGDDLKETKRMFAKFKQNEGVNAAVDYLDMIILGIEKSGKYEKKMAAVVAKYPNYALAQLENISSTLTHLLF